MKKDSENPLGLYNFKRSELNVLKELVHQNRSITALNLAQVILMIYRALIDLMKKGLLVIKENQGYYRQLLYPFDRFLVIHSINDALCSKRCKNQVL